MYSPRFDKSIPGSEASAVNLLSGGHKDLLKQQSLVKSSAEMLSAADSRRLEML